MQIVGCGSILRLNRAEVMYVHTASLSDQSKCTAQMTSEAADVVFYCLYLQVLCGSVNS